MVKGERGRGKGRKKHKVVRAVLVWGAAIFLVN